MFSLFSKPKAKKGTPQANVGRAGEEIATAFLLDLGFTVLTRNYRKRFGEIDIIAEDGEVLVFVEVKTRRSDRFGSPFEAVHARKQQRMAKAALAYIGSNGQHDRAARFDVIAVRLKQDAPPQIEHIRNAFDMDFDAV